MKEHEAYAVGFIICVIYCVHLITAIVCFSHGYYVYGETTVLTMKAFSCFLSCKTENICHCMVLFTIHY